MQLDRRVGFFSVRVSAASSPGSSGGGLRGGNARLLQETCNQNSKSDVTSNPIFRATSKRGGGVPSASSNLIFVASIRFEMKLLVTAAVIRMVELQCE